MKAAGAGHCGDFHAWTVAGGVATEVEHRARGCDEPLDDDADLPPPREWPLVE